MVKDENKPRSKVRRLFSVVRSFVANSPNEYDSIQSDEFSENMSDNASRASQNKETSLARQQSLRQSTLSPWLGGQTARVLPKHDPEASATALDQWPNSNRPIETVAGAESQYRQHTQEEVTGFEANLSHDLLAPITQ